MNHMAILSQHHQPYHTYKSPGNKQLCPLDFSFRNSSSILLKNKMWRKTGPSTVYSSTCWLMGTTINILFFTCKHFWSPWSVPNNALSRQINGKWILVTFIGIAWSLIVFILYFIQQFISFTWLLVNIWWFMISTPVSSLTLSIGIIILVRR